MLLKEHLKTFREETEADLHAATYDGMTAIAVAKRLIGLIDVLISHIDDPKPKEDPA